MNNEINVEKGNIIPKEKDKFGGYISRLVLNNNTEITINESDIVVFVGPNNVGKSQSLKDIYQLCEGKKTSIVIKDIEIVKRKGDIFKLLDSISTVNDYGSYKGILDLDLALILMIFQDTIQNSIIKIRDHYLSHI